jgi:hypothetical protein
MTLSEALKAMIWALYEVHTHADSSLVMCIGQLELYNIVKVFFHSQK